MRPNPQFHADLVTFTEKILKFFWVVTPARFSGYQLIKRLTEADTGGVLTKGVLSNFAGVSQ